MKGKKASHVIKGSWPSGRLSTAYPFHRTFTQILYTNHEALPQRQNSPPEKLSLKRHPFYTVSKRGLGVTAYVSDSKAPGCRIPEDTHASPSCSICDSLRLMLVSVT